MVTSMTVGVIANAALQLSDRKGSKQEQGKICHNPEGFGGLFDLSTLLPSRLPTLSSLKKNTLSFPFKRSKNYVEKLFFFHFFLFPRLKRKKRVGQIP